MFQHPPAARRASFTKSSSRRHARQPGRPFPRHLHRFTAGEGAKLSESRDHPSFPTTRALSTWTSANDSHIYIACVFRTLEAHLGIRSHAVSRWADQVRSSVPLFSARQHANDSGPSFHPSPSRKRPLHPMPTFQRISWLVT